MAKKIVTKCRQARVHLNDAMFSFYEARETGELTNKQADSLAKAVASIMSKSQKVCRKYD